MRSGTSNHISEYVDGLAVSADEERGPERVEGVEGQRLPGEQGRGLHSVLDGLVVEPEALRRVGGARALSGISMALMLAP